MRLSCSTWFTSLKALKGSSQNRSLQSTIKWVNDDDWYTCTINDKLGNCWNFVRRNVGLYAFCTTIPLYYENSTINHTTLQTQKVSLHCSLPWIIYIWCNSDNYTAALIFCKRGVGLTRCILQPLSSNCIVGRHLFHFMFTLLLYRDKSHSGCVECAVMMLRTQGDEGMIDMPNKARALVESKHSAYTILICVYIQLFC